MGEWVEVKDIAKILPPWVIENLGVNSVIDEATGETVGDNCIDQAESYVNTLLQARGKIPPPSIWLPYLKKAVVSLALHYLYARIEQESIAEDKLRDAKERLSMLFEGDMPGSGEEGIKAGIPAVGVAPGREDWNGFK